MARAYDKTVTIKARLSFKVMGMFDDVVLFHRSGSVPFGCLGERGSAEGLGTWFEFNTCMRKIAVGDLNHIAGAQKHLQSGDELYRGDDAYRFLLQVICGLHSPLVGETEVLGQFKNAVSRVSLPSTPWGGQMNRLFQALFEDAKRVRQSHLEELGSQSYGSLLRRLLREFKKVHVLGAGHIVQEILPWLCKDRTDVHIHCRNVAKARAELGGRPRIPMPSLRFHATDERRALASAEAVVVAAPVSAAWLSDWFPARLRFVADLRGDSSHDPISGVPSVLALADLVSSISNNVDLLEARKKAALAAIDDAVRGRSRHVEHRPFGWEDLCA